MWKLLCEARKEVLKLNLQERLKQKNALKIYKRKQKIIYSKKQKLNEIKVYEGRKQNVY